MPLFRLKSERSSFRSSSPPPPPGQLHGHTLTPNRRPIGDVPSAATAVPNGDVNAVESRLGAPTFANDCLRRDFGILIECSWPAVPTVRKRRSRLMPSLDETIRDQGTRRHFLQFLRTKRDSTAANQLQFWLDADSFQAVTKARLARHSLHSTFEKEARTQEQSPASTEVSATHGCLLAVDAEKENQSKCFPPPEVSSVAGQQSFSNGKQMAHKLWRSVEQDAVVVFTSYIAKDASNPIGVPDELRDEVTHKICDENGLVDPRCFEPAQVFVLNDIAEKRYFQDFVQSVYHCRYQVDVLTGGDMSLEDVLYNEPSLFFFMEFVEIEGQRDLLEFWLAADNFYGHLMNFGGEGHYDGVKAQEDAMILYDRYFSLQATCPLGFSDAIRLDVEQNICREEGPTPMCFERAIVIVLAVLERVYFESFLASQLYVKYLNELVNAVRITCDEESPATVKRRSEGSDYDGRRQSTTPSLGNTLLAMDSTPVAVRAGASPVSPRRISRRKFGGGDMRIDTGQFVPDALWRRKHAGRLTIGYVNDVGQFITDLEPEPDKRSATESMLTKAVKRFVYKDDDKTKEDMALQVARMIIHEVIAVTLRRRRDDATNT